MNKISRDLGIALLLAVGLTLVFYFDIWVLVGTPMSSSLHGSIVDTSTSTLLQDPAVSHWVFVPGIKTLQFELFNHINLLWSNLRGLGMPMLVNDIQVAPLYPLTLLFLWVPGEYFWNIFVLVRWIIFASGAYLLAARCFRFNFSGSSIFVLTFVFALSMHAG